MLVLPDNCFSFNVAPESSFERKTIKNKQTNASISMSIAMNLLELA